MNNHKITHAPVGFADIATCSDSFFYQSCFSRSRWQPLLLLPLFLVHAWNPPKHPSFFHVKTCTDAHGYCAHAFYAPIGVQLWTAILRCPDNSFLIITSPTGQNNPCSWRPCLNFLFGHNIPCMSLSETSLITIFWVITSLDHNVPETLRSDFL